MGNPNIKNYGFGARPREVDDEYRSRIKGVPRKRIWTKDKCIEELEDCLVLLKKLLKDSDKLETDDKKLKNESVKDATMLMNRVLEYMKYLYPPVQENINLNIEMQLDNVIQEWMKKKKGLVVVEDAT